MDLGNRFFVYSLTFYFIPVNHYRYHATDRGKPNTRVTSRKVDGCVGRNLAINAQPLEMVKLAAV
jgi:hypothetical protein